MDSCIACEGSSGLPMEQIPAVIVVGVPAVVGVLCKQYSIATPSFCVIFVLEVLFSWFWISPYAIQNSLDYWILMSKNCYEWHFPLHHLSGQLSKNLWVQSLEIHQIIQVLLHGSSDVQFVDCTVSKNHQTWSGTVAKKSTTQIQS